MGNLFDFENDFTEEEEAVFAPKGMEVGPSRTGAMKAEELNTIVAKAATGRSLIIDKDIVALYQAGVPVTQIMKKYSLSTGRFYDILKSNGTALRVPEKQTNANKPANLFKKTITTDGYIFTGDLAERYGLTPGQLRHYCQSLEAQGYTFARIDNGQRRGRIFNQKDITIIDRMIEEIRIHSMVEAATLALYNHDVQPPKVDVKLEGETLYINIARTPKWTAEEINVVINLKEEN